MTRQEPTATQTAALLTMQDQHHRRGDYRYRIGASAAALGVSPNTLRSLVTAGWATTQTIESSLRGGERLGYLLTSRGAVKARVAARTARTTTV